MLNDEHKKTVIENIVPLLNGWKINDALEALEYAKGYISDFATLTLPPPQVDLRAAAIVRFEAMICFVSSDILAHLLCIFFLRKQSITRKVSV